MSFRNFDNNWGWILRWITPPLVLIMGSAMLYFRSEFFTRAESLELIPIPAKVQHIEKEIAPLKSAPSRLDLLERDMDPLKPLPVRVQLLEEKAVQQITINAKRDTQIDALVTAMNTLATQQGIAIAKIDELAKRNERMENKLDNVSNRVAN